MEMTEERFNQVDALLKNQNCKEHWCGDGSGWHPACACMGCINGFAHDNNISYDEWREWAKRTDNLWKQREVFLALMRNKGGEDAL